MKRSLLLSVVLALALCIFAPVTSQESAPEIPDGPYLPVYVSEVGEKPITGAEAGDFCGIRWSPVGMYWTDLDHQIIVKDETGKTISVTTVEGEYRTLEGSGDLSCVFESTISLPDAGYYTVYLNDQHLVTYTADTLPTDPDDGLLILLGESPFE